MKKSKWIVLLLLFMLRTVAISQTLSGQLSNHPNAKLNLNGSKGSESVLLGSVTTDAKGNFTLTYSNYIGIATLSSDAETSLLLVVNAANLQIKGTHLKELNNLTIYNSEENILFDEYVLHHSQRENALAGWKYLEKRYAEKESVLYAKAKTLNEIENEIKRIETEDSDYLSMIDKSLYVSWYLPVRRLLNDMPASVDHYYERIPIHVEEFRTIDFTDSRFLTSGLRNQLIETHIWMLENSGGDMDSIYQKMNRSTDYLLENTKTNTVLHNDISEYLLKLYEKRSLFVCAEYLSLKLLTQDACVLDDKLANRAELYRAMKVGKTTEDISFSDGAFRNGVKMNDVKALSDVSNKYTFVIFGASWCPKCQEELMHIKKYYASWQEKDIEVVFISIDEDPKMFNSFSEIFPWISTCDLKGWEGDAVKDYYVFGTPTMFLLDRNRIIVERIFSVEQMKGIVEYKL